MQPAVSAGNVGQLAVSPGPNDEDHSSRVKSAMPYVEAVKKVHAVP